MEKEYDEIVDEEDDIIEFEIIDGKMYLSLENVNKSIDQATKNYKKVIDKAVLELVNIDGDLPNSQLSDRICNLIDILKEVSE